MTSKINKAVEMLFKARWNIPQAADHCEVTYDEMRSIFNKYCHENPPTYASMVESVDTPDLKSVGH